MEVTLPAAVQRQLSLADEYVQALTGTTGIPVVAGDGDQTSAAAQPVAQPAAPQPQPSQQEVPPAPVVSEETWEQKFKSLKGHFDAEVPRLHAALKEATGQNNQLAARVSQLEAQRAAPAPQPVAPTQPLITDKDREEFGPDLVALMERAARAAVAPLQAENATLLAEIARLNGSVHKVEKQADLSAAEVFTRKMSQMVGENWVAQNTDDGFIAWVNQPDPILGVKRKVILDQAGNAYDAVRAAAIFNAYRAETGHFRTAPAPQAQVNPELQSQVAPTRSRSAPAPQTPEVKKIWTNPEIQAFYNGIIKNAYTAEEAAKLEADIQLAIQEGRVR
jgi:hypothetical protein